MKTLQFVIKKSKPWDPSIDPSFDPHVVLIFGEGTQLTADLLEKIKSVWPKAIYFGCSTAGEISSNSVFLEAVAVTAIRFSATEIKYSDVEVHASENSFEAGKTIVKNFPEENLRHILLLSDGIMVNGSELVEGMRGHLPKGVNVTGGLAGDGERFKETHLITATGQLEKGKIAALAFYGNALQVGFGSFGGWDSFGIERCVTLSNRNVLYEIDGQPALELYKSFLGEQAKNLPAAAMLFPLGLRTNDNQPPVVRTILSIDENRQSMTFAGDIPQGSYVRLMKANTDRLIKGAQTAAETSKIDTDQPVLAILISCIGRRLVLKQLVEEEVEAVCEILPKGSTITGFYSYGEICPFSQEMAFCELHNQTMTITTLCEA